MGHFLVVEHCCAHIWRINEKLGFLSLSLGQELISESRLPPALCLPSIAGSRWTWLFPKRLFGAFEFLQFLIMVVPMTAFY